ncbi:MAG: ABC transporter ATP-binding protein [Methanocellales archaeon]
MVIMEIKEISKTYNLDHKSIEVLDNISFNIDDNDFIVVVGPSGCGKSTLLRIIVGLEKPTTGIVLYKGEPIRADNPKVAMVFQSFALLPWLTVMENVELGLEAMNMPREEMIRRAHKYIDAVGLDGFEDAYPRELSGGMKQRVGLARALAVEPALLCMDEPFSSLDALTAQNLRDEVLMLWENRALPPDAVLMVTHNIEEAVYLASRIIVLSHRPGRIIADLKVDLPRPRIRNDPAFYYWTDKIYSLIV